MVSGVGLVHTGGNILLKLLKPLDINSGLNC